MGIKSFFRKLVLSTEETPDNGYVAADMSLKELIGKTGVAKTPLRPAGTATIDGEPVDVVTLGEFLPAGTTILVTGVEGMRIIVKET